MTGRGRIERGAPALAVSDLRIGDRPAPASHLYWDTPGAEFEAEYISLLSDILQHGNLRSDRTGTGTRSLFGCQMRFDLGDYPPADNAWLFPLLTTKKLHFKSILHELLWFLSGSTNIGYLRDKGVSIWDEWADEEGELGPVYGWQWRNWIAADGRVIDQVGEVVHDIRTRPDSRRLIVSAWNPGDIDRMALPPCHLLFQFYVHDGALSLQMYQRSADVFLGLPFNIASYALLLLMIAQVTDLRPGEFILSLGDAHLYNNHTRQAKLLLSRRPYPPPRLRLDPGVGDLDDFRAEHVKLVHYEAHPPIPAPIAV